MATQTPPDASREKTGIPKNPGRRDLGMRATLLFPNREIVEQYYVPLIYTACRTCYSEQDPDEIFRRAIDGDFDPLKMQKLISSVIESGHGSTIEHVVFTFAISGVSRTLSHQLVRHRAGVAFDQQSQRYVKFKGAATMLPHSIGAWSNVIGRSYAVTPSSMSAVDAPRANATASSSVIAAPCAPSRSSSTSAMCSTIFGRAPVSYRSST